MKADYNGHEFEYVCAKNLRKQGFTNVQVTKGSGDQGIDVIAYKNGEKYGIQCKYYSSPVGNHAVQEAYAGAKYYNCDHAVVMTNNTFTKSAYELASRIGVQLWENSKVEEKSNISCLGSAGIAFLILLIISWMNNPKTQPLGLVVIILTVLCFIIRKKKKTQKKEETIDDINREIEETITHLGNIYLNFFKEHYFIDVKLVNSRMINDKTNEFIYSVETEDQAKYLLTKEPELNANLKDIHEFTLLTNNHVSLLVKRIRE